MRKCFISVIVMCLFIFSACGNQGKSYVKSISKEDTVTYSINGKDSNGRLQKFIDNVDNGKVDRINLVRYTTEGAPIITQLYFNGEDIGIAVDNSKDGMAGQDKNEIQYKTIKGGKQLKESLMEYLKEYFPQ